MTDRPITQSGEPITLMNIDGEHVPCRRCGCKPATGIAYEFDGARNFKCDTCGKSMRLGLTEEGARENHSIIAGMNKAEENRTRLYRDQDAKKVEDMERAKEDYASRGDALLAEKAGFLWDTFIHK